MKKLTLISVTVFVIGLSFNSEAQIDYKVWVHEVGSTCIEFNPKKSRMNIAIFYDNYLKGKARFEYSIGDSILTIDWYHNETIFGYKMERSTWIFNLDQNGNLKFKNLTDKTNGFIIELFDGFEPVFKITDFGNCSEYYDKL